jgi:hypothetical protein
LQNKGRCSKGHGLKWFIKNSASKNVLGAYLYMNYSLKKSFFRACKYFD